MLRRGLTRILLATALAAMVSATAAAQDDSTTPEGIDWHLAGYGVNGEVGIVPWYVDATLLLEDGVASGFTGCSRFSGSYTIDGDSLVFEPTLTMTRMACTEPASAIENGVLANLPQTASWSVTDGFLSLVDADGGPLLDFEQSVVGLTTSDLAAIATQLENQQADIDRAHQRIDNTRIGTLRDRIKELEASVKTLRSQAAAAASSSSSSSSAYNAREKVLLKAIPNKVRKTCRPLRSGLPSGTVAAVACDGARDTVTEMAYYLMEWADAEATLKSVARANGATRRRPTCHNQRAGWTTFGAPVGAEACWIDDGVANYRLITTAAGCHQLDVAGTHLTEPAIYLALEGKDRRIEPVRATGLAYTDASIYLMNFDVGGSIPQGDQPQTPACRALS